MGMDEETPAPAESFDSDFSPPEAKGPPAWLLYGALVVAVIALGVGFLGFSAANSAKAELTRLEAAVGTATESLAPQIEAMDGRVAGAEAAINSFEERMTGAGTEFVKLNRQDRQLGQDMQRGLEGLQSEIARNRTQLNNLSEQLEEVGTRLTSRSAPAPARTPMSEAGSSANDAPAATPPPDGVHVIVSGDTLSKIASQYGISLQALQEANPGVNSRYLRIGQHIYIPEN